MNEELTPWFFATTPPVHPGVYETRHRGVSGVVITGYSHINMGRWGLTRDTPEAAVKYKGASGQQSKEWRGLTKETT